MGGMMGGMERLSIKQWSNLYLLNTLASNDATCSNSLPNNYQIHCVHVCEVQASIVEALSSQTKD